VRVSTAEQASNGESLDTQKQQITGYAMMKASPICLSGAARLLAAHRTKRL
jgi:hypothetical protein